MTDSYSHMYLQNKYDSTAKDTDKVEKQLTVVNKELDELKAGIKMLFNRLKCDNR